MNSYFYKEWIVLDNQEIAIKAKLFDDAYHEGNFIGTFIMKRLEFETENDVDFKGKEIVFYKAYKENENDNWIQKRIGTFIVVEIEESDTKEEVKVTCLDFGLKTAVPYISNLNYASGDVTLQNVCDEALNSCGFQSVQLEINAWFIVDSNQFPNSLIGDVVKAIAQTQGSFAKINGNDQVEFRFKNNKEVRIYNYENLDLKRDTRPFTIITMGLSSIEGESVSLIWEDGVTLYGENELKINDNPFAFRQEKRSALLPAIFENLKGFGYTSFESKGEFMPFAETGDIAKVHAKNGDIIDSIVLRTESNFDDSNISAPSIINSTIKYKHTPDAFDILKRYEVFLDRELGTFNVDLREIREKLDYNELHIEEVSNKLEISIDATTNTIKKLGGSNLIHDSAFYKLNADEENSVWDIEDAIYNIVQDTKIEQESDSNSKIVLKSGSISQQIKTIVNSDYSIAFKYKITNRTTEPNAILRILFSETNWIDVLNSSSLTTNWIEVPISFVANSSNITISLFAKDCDFEITDLRLTRTDSIQSWTQSENESYGKTSLFDETGFTLYDPNSNVRNVMNNDSNTIFERNRILSEVSDERHFSKKGEFEESVKIGKSKLVALSNDLYVFTKEN